MRILLSLSLALLAVWWGVPSPRATQLRRRLDGGPAATRRTPRRWLGPLGWVLATGVAAGAAWLLGGPRPAVLVVTAASAAGTALRLLRHQSQLRRSLWARAEVARACALLASHLRVGQVPTVALALAAADCPVLAESRRALEVGGDVTRVWRAQAVQDGYGGLTELSRAWQVSTETGAPMSATLEQVAAGLAADQSLRSVVSSELAAPRATSKVMAALPLCGVGLGYLLGGDPLHWLLATPAGWACLLGGVALACAGVLWIERLAARAATQA